MSTKPTIHRFFYDNYFLPAQKRMIGRSIRDILEEAVEDCPIQVKMSMTSLKRLRRKRI
ncbi:hypothetical protein [Spirosoma sp. KNUC1025]|uniref:hypothetical protein n=1 Tax=Spirosoma sp. KNUC1025 TaxID=2894082 RepID=UPI003868DE14|nr:hypothetical protein LN737_19285 [Spirosoma sp. KNUC1025]